VNVPVTAATGRQRLWALQARLAPYLFISPFVILFAVFMAYPLVRSLAMSLYQTAGARTRFVGVRNYEFLFHDRLFWLAAFNTVGYTIAFLIFQIPAALLLAMLLNGKAVRGRNLFRFAFFAPSLVGQVFVAVIFGLMLSNNGPINETIRLVWPSAEINWITDWRMARPAVVIASLWLSVGFGMIYFLAALQAVDVELYEASNVDGAGRWAQFWHVTVPGIRPVLTFMILTGTIGGLQLFELPYVLFNGPGPGGAGLTIVAYLFSWVEAGELGTAAASGWALAAAVIVVAIVQARLMRESKDEL
jgi:ABC-type sugar transport system permease subunit